MKKLIVILMPVLLSCSGDDAKGTPAVSHTFNPPAWLHGTWMPQSTQQADYFTVTKSDVCYNAAHANFICWSEAVAVTKQNDIDYDFWEHGTDSTYAVNYTVNDVVTSVEFKKLTAGKMNVTVANGAEPKGAAGVFLKKS